MEEILEKIDELRKIIGSFSARERKSIEVKIKSEAVIHSFTGTDSLSETICSHCESNVSSSIKIDDYETIQ